METSTIILSIALILFVVAVIFTFDKLVKGLNKSRDAFRKIDETLKKRTNLISELIDILKKNETEKERLKEDINKVDELVENLKEKMTISKRQRLEDKLSSILKELFKNIENSTDEELKKKIDAIKAQLNDIEKELLEEINEYSKKTMEYNKLRNKFPFIIFTKVFEFKKIDYFEIELLTTKIDET